MVKLLYVNPLARILTNQILSPRLDLLGQTNQGCTLSLLIFALAIEPLAESIHKDPIIFGYDTDKTTNIFLFYADYVLLCITQPETTLPAILDKIMLFGTFSGYRINMNKSEVLHVCLNNVCMATISSIEYS